MTPQNHDNAPFGLDREGQPHSSAATNPAAGQTPPYRHAPAAPVFQPSPSHLVQGVFGAIQPQPGLSPDSGQKTPVYDNNNLGIFNLVLAILFAPAGVIVGLITTIKGQKIHSKRLTFIGIGTVVLSLVVMLSAVALFNRLHNSALEVGDLKRQELAIGRNTVVIEIPDKLTKGRPSAENQQIYTIKGQNKDGKETAAAQVSVSIVEDAYSSDELLTVKSALADPSGQNGKLFTSAVKKSLMESLTAIGCSNTVMQNPETFKPQGAEFAAKFPFQCDITGGGRYKGYMVDAGDQADESIILVGAAEEMWNKNSQKFEKTVESIVLKRN